MVRPIELKADEEAAERLALPSVAVATLVYRRLYEGTPFNRTRVYLPPWLGQQLVEARAVPDRGPVTVISTIERFLNKPVEGASQSVTAVPAPPDVAPLIECESGEPCLRIERLYFDTEGTPVELSVIHSNPKRYSYELEVRRRVR